MHFDPEETFVDPTSVDLAWSYSRISQVAAALSRTGKQEVGQVLLQALDVIKAHYNPWTIKTLRAALDAERDTNQKLTDLLEVEPDQPLGQTSCPSCGSRLEICHGEEVGKISCYTA